MVLVHEPVTIMQVVFIQRVDLRTLEVDVVRFGVQFRTAVCPVCGAIASECYLVDEPGVFTREIVCDEGHNTTMARVDASGDLALWTKLAVETGVLDGLHLAEQHQVDTERKTE